MNIFDLIRDGRALISAGNELKNSGTLVNIEALAALIYSVLAALIRVLTDLGIKIDVSWVDLHTVSSGWAITAGLVYSGYRVATHAAAGLPQKAANEGPT